MRAIYETTNGADAHVVSGLLEQLELRSEVVGENMGMYGHPLGSVWVLVAPECEEAARKIVADWEAGQSEAKETYATGLWRRAFAVLAGAAVLLAVFW